MLHGFHYIRPCRREISMAARFNTSKIDLRYNTLSKIGSPILTKNYPDHTNMILSFLHRVLTTLLLNWTTNCTINEINCLHTSKPREFMTQTTQNNMTKVSTHYQWEGPTT